LSFGTAWLTYAELAARASALAAELRRRGVGPEVLVGVAMERSLEMVVALVAVLEAGGAYVPIDPGYPPERVAFMLADALAGGGVLLTQAALAPAMAALLPVDVDVQAVDARAVDLLAVDQLELPPAPRRPSGAGAESPAYAIYTSGSTGRPKGAVNRHRAIRNRLLWMQQTFALGAGDRVLQKTPFSFDVSVWEFFWPLLTGAELVIAEPGGHQDPA
jgi:non-ribosomal peptide synthetase component F